MFAAAFMHPRTSGLALPAALVLLIAAGSRPLAAQDIAALPDSPQANVVMRAPVQPASPCQVRRSTVTFAWAAVDSAGQSAGGPAAAAAAAAIGTAESRPRTSSGPELLPCPILPIVGWYSRFVNGPQAKPMKPREKAWLAVRDVVDPFNTITILGSSAIAVASNAHSDYGPGFPGWGRYVGVSYSQDMTGEFIGTFLIPSIVHQDPRYHRLPTATLKRRIAHCLYQVLWTQGDDGKGMVNYADVVGFAIDDEIGDLYVPGQRTDLPSSAKRYGIGLATAPIENFVNEFLPDVARRIHIRVVLIQRIINQVANKEAGGQL